MADSLIPSPAQVFDLRTVDPYNGTLPRFNQRYKRRHKPLSLEEQPMTLDSVDGDLVEISPEAREAFLNSAEAEKETAAA